MSIAEHNTNGSFTGGDIIILCHQGGPFGSSDLLSIPNSGTVSQQIIYRGEANPGSNWHWSGSLYQDASDNAISASGKNYITVENLKIRYMTAGIVFGNYGDGIIIQNNEIQWCIYNAAAIRSADNENSCVDNGGLDADCSDDAEILDNTFYCNGVGDGHEQLELDSTYNATVSGNHIYCTDVDNDTTYPCVSTRAGSPGPFNAGIDGILTYDSLNAVIEYNKIGDHRKEQRSCSGIGEATSDDGENAIDMKSMGRHDIRYNELFGTTNSIEGLIHFHYCGAASSDDLRIYGNWFHDTDSDTGAIAVWPQNTSVCRDIKIWSNIFSNIPKFGISTTGGSDTQNVEIYNNSFYEVGGTGASSHVPVYATASGGTNKIKNNLLEETDNSNNIFFDIPSSWESTNNKAYDSSGTEQVDLGSGSEAFSGHDGSSTNIEGSSTDFDNASNNDFSTSSNVGTAADLGDSYDIGLDEDTVWANVLQGSGAIIAADRDNFNSGTWGMGAYVYGSSVASPPETEFTFQGLDLQ